MTDTFPAAAALADAQDRCDYWNARFPDGTEVRIHNGTDWVPARTTSAAMVVGRTAVVHVAGVRKPIALSHVSLVTSEEVQR
ncbi:hypothetical protein AB0H71_13975 [Nocardia sp. NPDC050697]|uniref:hypothetical protein n=1 Tax=Nocardia sp. NPDC050697 TaxID=3155158 RepID=UPI0033D27859